MSAVMKLLSLINPLVVVKKMTRHSSQSHSGFGWNAQGQPRFLIVEDNEAAIEALKKFFNHQDRVYIAAKDPQSVKLSPHPHSDLEVLHTDN
jgi:hypothetical protein